MAQRLTDAQVRSARVQALRAVRRAERALDTQIEVMERRLDRSIENKERVTVVVAESIIKDFNKFVGLMRELEGKLADLGVVFVTTGGSWPGQPTRI